MKKYPISVTIEEDLREWLTNSFENSSKAINEMLRKEYNKKKDVNVVFDRLMNERKKTEEELEKLFNELGRIQEEGNKEQRERAEEQLKEEQKEIKRVRDELLPLLRFLQKHDRWNEFVNKFRELKVDDLIEWNDLFMKDGIDTRGWNTLRKLFNRFSIEELLKRK